MRILLVDNGSLRPDSWINLCRLAESLERRAGEPIQPASVLHSTRMDAEGIPERWPRPTTWERATKAALEARERAFLVVPLFFGPTGAITEYLPERRNRLAEKWGEFSVRFAPCLAEPVAHDATSLSAMLARQVRTVVEENGLLRPPVILVDHGSPRAEVTAVRDRLGPEVAAALGSAVDGVRVASMERRDGRAYDFNEPLLERALRDPAGPAGPVVLARLFLSPGRHAGPGGDIDRICRAAEGARPGLQVFSTPLVGEDPGLIDLLEARLRVALAGS